MVPERSYFIGELIVIGLYEPAIVAEILFFDGKKREQPKAINPTCLPL